MLYWISPTYKFENVSLCVSHGEGSEFHPLTCTLIYEVEVWGKSVAPQKFSRDPTPQQHSHLSSKTNGLSSLRRCC